MTNLAKIVMSACRFVFVFLGAVLVECQNRPVSHPAPIAESCQLSSRLNWLLNCCALHRLVIF